MHRFRRKSDAKRSQVPEHLLVGNSSAAPPSPLPNQQDISANSFPSLPPVSDFRTSLILPSLSRRFTLLRDSNGDPVSLDDVRSKFAELRATGAEHQLTEEEEEMVVQALCEIRTANTFSLQSGGSLPSTAHAPGGDSIFAEQQDVTSSDYSIPIRNGAASTPTTPSYSPLSARAPYRLSNKRNSNNLFSSHRFHDTSYLHSVSKNNRNTPASLSGSDSQGGSVRSTRSFRDTTENGTSGSKQEGNGEPKATQENKAREVQAPSTFGLSTTSSRIEYTPHQIGRATLALEQAFRGIEEEAEETIMIPRRSVSRTGTSNSRTQSPKPQETSVAGTPIPWMTDEARVDDRDEDDRGPVAVTHVAAPSPLSPAATLNKSHTPPPVAYRPGTISPTPRIPGYIPGMPRPITPAKDVDSDRDDGLTGYSTTPRARSPASPFTPNYLSHTISHSFSSTNSRHHSQSSVSSDVQSQPILPPSILRSSRGTGPAPPLRTTSPGLGARSRGNSISGSQVPSPLPSPGPDDRFRSDFMLRRPLSPLMAGLSPGQSNSRPSTPAAIWSPPPLVRAQSPPRISESPRPENTHARNGNSAGVDPNTKGSLTFNPPWLSSRNGLADTSQDSSISSIELGQSLHPPHSAASAKIAARVPTPVSTRTRPPPVFTDAQDPILLNRVPSKRTGRGAQTPPPQSPAAAVVTPVATYTSTTSSNSSSNLNPYGRASPMFSPNLNSSSTSLLSISSGYHSWTEENARKNKWDELLEYNARRIDWRALLDQKKKDDISESESEVEGMGNAEEILKKKLGVTKQDIVSLQARLVEDAIAKRNAEQGPRSPVRRRRVSASRASLQTTRENGTNSPAPPPRQPTPVVDINPLAISPSAPESKTRAHILLDTVLNSIQEPQSNTSSALSSAISSDATTVEPKSTTDEESASKSPSTSSSRSESREEDSSASRYKAIVQAIEEVEEKSKQQQQQQQQGERVAQISPVTPPARSQSIEEDSGEATEVPRHRTIRNQAPPVQPTANAQLVREVSKRAAEATARLKPGSGLRLGESDSVGRRKRIDLQQISNPHLVSSSTNVNAIPIVPSPVVAAPPTSPSTTQLERSTSLRFADRFKKLQRSLRTKPSSRDGSEVTPFIIPPSARSDVSPQSGQSSALSPTSPSAQTLTYIQRHYDVPASAIEQTRIQAIPVPTPPASAGPGLKRFISRFRKSGKDVSATESTTRQEVRQEPIRYIPPTSPLINRAPVRLEDGRYSNLRPPTPVRSATPARSPTPGRPSTPARAPTPARRSEDFLLMDSHSTSPRSPASPTADPVAISKFIVAGEELGFSARELSDLLARSTSRSSRTTTWTQNSAPMASSTEPPPVPRGRGEASLERAWTPESSFKGAQLRPNPVNKYPEGEVVRRTIIFASDNPSVPDLAGMGRKDSLAGRPSRSASAASVHSLPGAEQSSVPKVSTTSIPRGGHTSKHSQSSSFFEPFDQDVTITPQRTQGEGSAPGVAISTEDGMAQGQALEVLQLSNGQVIWSVIDSLRAAEDEDEDSQSLFRRSFSSSRGGHDGEEMEIRVKEHRRWESKASNQSQGSTNANVPRRRQPAISTTSRPETRVYKTDATTIGRLIEDLSRNMDSGTFNFQRTPPTSASAATSFHSDESGPGRQVEKDLDALLKAINSGHV